MYKHAYIRAYMRATERERNIRVSIYACVCTYNISHVLQRGVYTA